MIITNLKGGLGNQMFQYALGRKLALENNDTLKLDTAGLERANALGDIYRPFALDAFCIAATPATTAEIERLKYPHGIFSKIVRRLRFKILRQTHTGWEPAVLKKTGNLYLDGYWQSPKYFADVRKTILSDLTLAKPLSSEAAIYADQIRATESISIHVRRGDYATNPRVTKEFGICSPQYYQEAIKTIATHTTDPHFFVFSDDIGWVKKNLPLPDNTVYITGNHITDAEEITLMSYCKHNIIANSSFSWWGAWLNRNPEKIVIAPTPWFNVGNAHKDLIPDLWTRLPK